MAGTNRESLFLLEGNGQQPEVSLPTSIDRDDATFPSDYFADNNKPKVKVYDIMEGKHVIARKKTIGANVIRNGRN